jgi:diacylglycerol kinase
VFATARVPRFTARETGYCDEGKSTRREMTMGLLWLLVLLLIIFALVGGVAVNSWLFIILVIALILLLVGYV